MFTKIEIKIGGLSLSSNFVCTVFAFWAGRLFFALFFAGT
ncbi:secreted protein [gut metagenome]|uniref:Secreted protein n=1 Tax=gut metagenome TaxID=749906 RepID=J9H4M0_9ZZZZ